MTANLELSGTYQVQGRKLVNQDKPFLLILDQRNRLTKTKTPTFLVAKSTTGNPFPETGKQDQYISSVYPTVDRFTDQIEYQGTRYQILWTGAGDTVTIQPKTQMVGNNKYHL